jgi:hypothetical protein
MSMVFISIFLNFFMFWKLRSEINFRNQPIYAFWNVYFEVLEPNMRDFLEFFENIIATKGA